METMSRSSEGPRLQMKKAASCWHDAIKLQMESEKTTERVLDD
jgi:hypothetical protein